MKYILPASAILFLLFSCNSPKEKSLESIHQLEAQDSIFSPDQIEKVKAAYLDFATKYPDDDMAPEFIFKAAQRCNVTSQHLQAIELFQRIIDKYPKHKMCEEALFLQGYIYENSLKDFVSAKRVYTDFIQKYPNSELTEDAKLALENMGKSPEEILDGFNKTNP